MLSTIVNASSCIKCKDSSRPRSSRQIFGILITSWRVQSHRTCHLHSLHLHLPTRHLNHHLQHQLNQDCRFPLLTGSRQTPHHETCRFHRAAACHSRADSCSSHYRTAEKRKNMKQKYWHGGTLKDITDLEKIWRGCMLP